MLHRRSVTTRPRPAWRGAARLALTAANILVYLRHPAKVLLFYHYLRYWPNICLPRNKNEKFIWRKVFDRNPVYRLIADKLAVRTFVTQRCPGLLTSEIVWTGLTPERIPESLLQPGFIIKTNNGSDRNIAIAQAPADRNVINRRIRAWLRRRYAVLHGEWVYHRINPMVLVERLIAARPPGEFVDISCHVAMGRCLFATVDKDVKQKSERIAVFDPAGRRIPVQCKPWASKPPCAELPTDYPAPSTYAEAIRCAERLSEDFDHIRVDFMSAGDDLYFCECTVFPMGGYSLMIGGDELIDAAWDLRNSWFMRQPQRGLAGVYRRLYRYCLEDSLTS